MARFLAFKQFNSLRPADEGGEAMLRKLKQGELVRVEYSRPRNIQHHRLFWALMSVVHDNLDHDNYPTVEDLAAAVKISAGHRTRIQLPNGEVGFIPKSIKFHKMEQDEFSAFYERVCDVIAKHFLPGVTSKELREEVEIMIGIKIQSTGASGDMGGDRPSEASVVASDAAVSSDAGAGEPDPQSAPPPANYSAPSWSNNPGLDRIGRIPPLPPAEHIEIARQSAPDSAGGDEARAEDVDRQPPLGSPSLFEQYWAAIQNGKSPRDVANISNKFFDKVTLPDDLHIRGKFTRIRTIRLNVLAGVYPKAEGEEKARSAIES